jgi:hypothetical protein
VTFFSLIACHRLQDLFKTSDADSTKRALCSLFLGGAAGSQPFNKEAALLVIATMDNCCIQVFSSGA